MTITLCTQTLHVHSRFVSINILVPIALFSSLSRRGLGTRIEGLWEHGVFELIWIFWLAVLNKQRNLERKSRCSRRLLALKLWNSCDQRRLWQRTWRIWEKILPIFHIYTFRCRDKTVFLLVDISGEKSSKQPEILKVLEILTSQTH